MAPEALTTSAQRGISRAISSPKTCGVVGIAVADEWQQLGLGHALLTRLAIHARANGFSRLRGSVMAGNEPMLALLQAGAEQAIGIEMLPFLP